MRPDIPCRDALLQGEVGGSDVGCSEDREEGNAGDCGFDCGSAALFSIYEAEDSGDMHSGFTRGLDCGDGGPAGGTDVVDDDDVCTGRQEAFDFASSAVSFFGFADEESLDEGGGEIWGFVAEVEFGGELEDLVVVGEGPGAGAGGVGDEGVGSHGESAYGFGVGDVMADEVVEDEAGEAAAFGVEGGDAAVDVVVGLLAAGEGEVAQLEGERGEEVEESGFVVSLHGPLDFWEYRSTPPSPHIPC